MFWSLQVICTSCVQITPNHGLSKFLNDIDLLVSKPVPSSKYTLPASMSCCPPQLTLTKKDFEHMGLNGPI